MPKPRPRKRPLLFLPLNRLIPNLVTLAGLCCGLSAMRLALEGRFETAVILLVAAAIIDGMDGRIARFLNSTSAFGAQLDSLSDFVCFGVAPVIILYMWKLHEVKDLGWALVLFYSVCCALRLARFNTHLNDDAEPWQSKFFIGIPSPAGAMLALMPLVMSFYAPGICDKVGLCILWVAVIAMLMASRVPTFAAKKIRIHHEWLLTVMLTCGVTIALIFIEPWIMFNVIGVAYCALIPLSFRRYRQLSGGQKNGSIPSVFSSEE